MRHQVFAFVAAIATACSLAFSSAMAEVEKVDIPGVSNFSKIDGAPGFAGSLVGFGGATSPSAMPGLKSAGFTTVLNLRLGSEDGANIDGSRAAAEAAGLHYISLPFDSQNPDPAVVTEVLSILDNKANQPVYIHCNSATRAAALWMIGRVLRDGWPVDTASKEVEMISANPSKSIAFATAYLASQNKPVLPTK